MHTTAQSLHTRAQPRRSRLDPKAAGRDRPISGIQKETSSVNSEVRVNYSMDPTRIRRWRKQSGPRTNTRSSRHAGRRQMLALRT